MTTAETLRLAATIADRLEQRGEPCTPEDAIERAQAAHLQVQQLKAMEALDWGDTVKAPPLPVGVSIASLMAVPLALSLAIAPALGQVQARYGTYTMPDGSIIPEGQNRSPAGHDAIAFRPACTQVAPVGQDNGSTAWVLNMPDGAARVLAEYPSALDAFEAQRYLSNDGLCAWGGVEVPIIYSAQLPQQQSAQQVSNPQGVVEGSDRPSANWVGVGAGALLLAGVAGVVTKMATAKPTAAPTDAKAKAADALDDLLGGARK